MISIVLPYPPSVNSEMDCAGVYKITDAKTSRVYYGSAANLKRRYADHVYRFNRGDHPNPIMQSIYNIDNSRLVFEVINKMPGAEKKERLAAEQILLTTANVGINRDCMNILPVAGSHEGRKRSQQTKDRLSLAMKGRTYSLETKLKMREAKLGGKLSEDHKKKIGDAARGKKNKRPNGIINHSLRKFSAVEIMELRSMRNKGVSWSKLAIHCGSKYIGTVRRAVLGITYKDII